MRYPTRNRDAAPTKLPSRGIWAIDQLKHLSRLEHVIGVDPGKRELIVGIDADDPKRSPVRYTQRSGFATFGVCSTHTRPRAENRRRSMRRRHRSVDTIPALPTSLPFALTAPSATKGWSRVWPSTPASDTGSDGGKAPSSRSAAKRSCTNDWKAYRRRATSGRLSWRTGRGA